MPTYRIVTLGCKLNQADSLAVEARLRALGLTRAAEDASPGAPARADVVVLNTCTVTGGADREARQIARRLRRAHPGAAIIATGCYAERDAAALRGAAAIDHVVGMRGQAAEVARLAAGAVGLAIDPLPGPADEIGPFGATPACDPADADRTRAFLKIQDGCDLRCSYCVIPQVRGASRSLALEAVAGRLRRLAEAGFQEVVLTGVNTGDWGRDLEPPRRLHDLLARALALPGPARLRLNSLEPRTVTPEIVRLLAEEGGRLARHVQIPLQSGSDAVLSRMRRNYRTADYARVVESIAAAAPDAALGADVIVGFPGETEAEHEATARFIAASPLAYLHVFSYSQRPGTSAALLPDQVPAAAVRERSARLRALARDLSLRFRRRFVGRALRALVLREVRPDGRLRALTDNFIDLGLDAKGRPAGEMFNRLVGARIASATETDTLAVVA